MIDSAEDGADYEEDKTDLEDSGADYEEDMIDYEQKGVGFIQDKCSLSSRRGLVQEDKRMVLVYTHGLFIT